MHLEHARHAIAYMLSEELRLKKEEKALADLKQSMLFLITF
jgi:hypothetical protein